MEKLSEVIALLENRLRAFRDIEQPIQRQYREGKIDMLELVIRLLKDVKEVS